ARAGHRIAAGPARRFSLRWLLARRCRAHDDGSGVRVAVHDVLRRGGQPHFAVRSAGDVHALDAQVGPALAVPLPGRVVAADVVIAGDVDRAVGADADVVGRAGQRVPAAAAVPLEDLVLRVDHVGLAAGTDRDADRAAADLGPAAPVPL